MTHIKDLLHLLLTTFLHNQNQFASGGLLLMAVGSILAMAKAVPAKIWAWFKNQITISVTVNDDSAEEFYLLRRWLSTQSFMKRARHLDVSYNANYENALSPAPGHNQYFCSHWRVFKLLVTRIEKKEEGGYTRGKRPETITLTTLGRNSKVFHQIVHKVKAEAKADPTPYLRVWSDSSWVYAPGYDPRPLDSVILQPGVKEDLVRDIQRFKDRKAWYVNLGIPYHRGYLLHGPPGTGKTSLACGLSSHFKADVYYLKLSGLTDDKLLDAVGEVKPYSLVVMEDIDAIGISEKRGSANKTYTYSVQHPEGAVKEKKEKPLIGVTLSGLLNVIDGIMTPVGAIFLMTTNHPEKLDPALIRPGRIDRKIHLDYAAPEQKNELHKKFFGNESGCPEELLQKQLTMAELQGHFMDM
jgi:chaperone BCS1